MGNLITPDYLQMNKVMHETNPLYGVSGSWRKGDVMHLAVQTNATSILDYGAGKGTLKKSLTLPVREYDPAIKGKDSPPEPADLVVCTDVLEHIEPECLDSVLDHLQSLTKKICFVIVHLTPAKKSLPDGRNAHLILKPKIWWEKQLARRFQVIQGEASKDGKEAVFVLRANENG